MGMGRHQRSTFDADTYINKVFPLMIERANSEGATHIGAAIEKVYKAEVLDDPPPAPQPAKPKRK
jgi:hypothetical protein